MKRFPAFPVALFLGFLTGWAMGAVRCRETMLALLEKNRLLTQAGHAALPGADFSSTLSSWGPAFAGGLFFALTLGIGGATLFYLFARFAGLLPRIPRRFLQAGAFAPAAITFGMGQNHLALALLILALIGFWTAEEAEELTDFRTILFRSVAALLLLASFAPWVMGGGDPFIRFRDRFLLSNAAGRTVTDFYYTYTLYPAETIKPLADKSQPVAALDNTIPADRAKKLAAEALALRVIAVPDRGHGADFTLVEREGQLLAERNEVSLPWPTGKPKELMEAFAELSKKSDRTRPVRRTTFWTLALGVPLAIALLLFGATRWLSELIGAGPKRVFLFHLVFLFLAALLLALSGLSRSQAGGYAPPERRLAARELGEALSSPDPAERFYAAADATAQAGMLTDELLARLDDPVLNVRYAAALTLGRAASPKVRARLLKVLENDPVWYVRERAYSALWMMGWRP